MAKSFQKPANKLRELQLPHPGIMNYGDFTKHFELRCYKPSPDLQPFVAYMWTQRSRRPLDSTYKPPVEIVSGPNVYAFFTPESAFIHTVAQREFNYNSPAHGVIAGIKFQPGGFYPFMRRLVSELDTQAPHIASVFPKADKTFTKKLLAQPDEIIVPMIEGLLRDSNPKNDKSLRLIAKIISALDTDSSLRTVGATAQAFDMSERSLQLLFQTYVGVGVKWILIRRRLIKAINHAKNQPHPTWATIAAELGYSSQSHFSRDFKEVTGLAPSEYVRSLRIFEAGVGPQKAPRPRSL